MNKVNKANFILQYGMARIEVFKTLILDFLPRSCYSNNFNWHCLFVEEALRDWIWMQKFKKLGMTLVSLHRNINAKSSSALRWRWSSFSKFRILLSIPWPYLLRKMSDINLDLEKRSRIKNKNTKAATLISIVDGKLIL